MLRFHVGPFPVTVEVSFLLSAVLLRMGYGVAELLAWVFVVFVSVLVHELGHAVFARMLGGRPEITLQAFGGLTVPRVPRRLSALESIGLSFAGPLAGLLLGVLATVVLVARLPALQALATEAPLRLFSEVMRHRAGQQPVDDLLFTFASTSVWWTVLNLLPILPLDGGNIVAAVIAGVRKKPSYFAAAVLSAVLAAGMAGVAFLVWGNFFMGLLFGLFAFSNVARARAERGVMPRQPRAAALDPRDQDEARAGLAAARAALGSGQVSEALLLADQLEAKGSPPQRAAALRIRAALALSQGDHARAGLLAGQGFALVPEPDSAVVAARSALREGDRERALTWLKRALETGAPAEAIQSDPELSQLVSQATPA